MKVAAGQLGEGGLSVEQVAEQLAAMHEASPIALAMLDLDLRYLWVNDRLAAMNGLSRAAHLGRTVEEVAPDIADQARAAFARLLAGEEVRGVELVGSSGGSPERAGVWRQHYMPIRDASGAMVAVGVATEDVSEERRAQRAVEALNRINTALAAEHDVERLVQMVTDAGVELTGASVGAYFHNIMDESGERLHLFTLAGHEREDFVRLGRPRATDVLGPIFRNVIIRSDDITRDPRYGGNAPFKGMPPGHPDIASYLAVPVVSGQGRVLGGLLFGHPRPGVFTARHEALIVGLAAQTAVAIENARLLTAVTAANGTLERRVAERTAELDRVWTMSRDLLVVLDLEGVFRTVNPAWTAILGHRPEEVVGRSYLDFLHPDDAALTKAAVTRGPGQVPVFENRFVAADGTVRWLSWLTAIDGDLVYASGRDVTEGKRKDEALRQTEEALRQSQKMEAMGQLTGGVAHDFNNLLTPILGGLDLLRRKSEGDRRNLRLIDGAIQSAERARTLVQRLLAFARRQPLQPDTVDLAAMMHDMSALLTTTLGPQVRLALEAEAKLPPAIADRNQLEMALLNLAVNARDAMPEGGELGIALSLREVAAGGAGLSPGRYICLSVADTGSGMDAGTMARAVEPFFTTKGLGRGSGLGLSMVHGLARQLGGALELESTPGVGTTARLLLPVSAAPVTVAEAPAVQAAPAVLGRVLLVDDEEAVRGAAAQMLSEIGYDVIEADCAAAAIALVDGGLVPDLLVSDHLMPGMTGTELARHLRGRLPAMGALIVSGYADVATLSPDLAHLPKPFRASDLSAALAGAKVFPVATVDVITLGTE